MFKTIFNIIFAVIFGALGALLFNFFALPYIISNPYFENYQFVKDFKQGKIVVNQKESVYIQENNAIEKSIENVKNSVVVIESPSLAIASGLVATSDGNIITVASAITNGGKLFLQGEQVDYTIVKIDKINNLALLKISKNNLPTVAFVDVNNVKLGQKVFLLAGASVKKDHWLANEGMIREISADSVKTNITEGSTVAGSPLFNVVGELVGLNIVDAKGSVSSIPVNKIRELLGL